MKKEGWAGIYKYVSVQLAYSHFNNQLKTYFDHHFPIQQTKLIIQIEMNGSIRH